MFKRRWKIFDIFYDVRALYRRIKRIVKWIPTLWNTYDFDYSSIFYILREHLSNMEKVIRKGYATNSGETADEIILAIRLLDRIIDRDYDENALKMASESDRKRIDLMDFEIKNGDFKMYSIKVSDSYRRAIKHAEEVKKSDVEYLFKLISRKHRGWWD
jgi:hypothetical protein